MLNKHLSEQQKRDLHFFFTSLGSFVTSISLYQTIKYQSRVMKLQRQIKYLQKEDVKTPSEVINSNMDRKSVVVKGRVTSPYEAPYTIRISGKIIGQEFVKHIQYKQKMYSNESYDLAKNAYKINLTQLLKVSQMKSVKDFALKDISPDSRQTKLQLKVINHDISKYQRALQMLKFSEQKHNLSLFQSLQGLFLSLLRAFITIGIPDQNVTFLRGIQTGVRTVDVGIRIGTPLTILGTILTDKNGELVIQPELIFKDRLRYLIDLKDDLLQESSKRNFWLAVTLLGAAYVGRRAYKYIEKNGWVAPWNLKKQ